jgi:hypothetical protein
VYSQGGHIVIEGRKGKGATSTATAIPAPTRAPKPKITVTPKPKVTQSHPLTTKKPVVKKPRKPRAKKTKVAATSFEDKLIESLPTAGIAYQPSFSPLVRTPVYFWSDIPKVVRKKIEIVGEMVTIELRPTFLWHYGDGTVYLTRTIGGAYPDGQIRHTYTTPGHYLIELITHWDGQFTIDGVSAPIPGEISTVSFLPITIAAAPVRFIK